MSSSRGLEAYFEEARTWDEDRSDGLRRSARAAWRVAAAGWACALAGSAAIVMLMPLKRVEPFVVRVDNSTGIVDVVPVYAGTAVVDESVTRYFLAHYVSVCERFNFATAESDYEECGSFHSAQRNQAWYAAWTQSNPASPLNLHKDGSIVTATVQSISFFARASGISDLAQVRYVKALAGPAGGEEQYSHWIATIQFEYSAPPRDPKVRRWNPLGFRVVDFRPEPEVLAGKGVQEPRT